MILVRPTFYSCIDYKQLMELSNNAIKIYRESVEFRRVNCAEATPTTKCLRSYNVLSQCLFQNKLNILDHDAVRATCQVDQWKSQCPGAIRRIHTERMYTRGLFHRLYTQQQLDTYMQVKNNFKHYGVVDHRY